MDIIITIIKKNDDDNVINLIYSYLGKHGIHNWKGDNDDMEDIYILFHFIILIVICLKIKKNHQMITKII